MPYVSHRRNLRENQDVDGMIILRRVIREWNVGMYGMDQAGLGYGQVAGICECDNEL